MSLPMINASKFFCHASQLAYNRRVRVCVNTGGTLLATSWLQVYWALFVYYTLAGFSEYDNFRSNQIREGLISREEALELCKHDNEVKYDTLKNFSDVIGFNLDNVLSRINCLDKLY